MDAPDWLDVLGQLRYGVPTSEKEALAASGELPGAPVDRTADQERANRYASGYLFAQQHPTLAPATLPMVNFVHGLFGDDPALQSQATAGMNRGLVERDNSLRSIFKKITSR